MPEAACSDAEFITLVEGGGVAGAAKALGINPRTVARRRQRLEGNLGRSIRKGELFTPRWLEFQVPDGEVLVGSDAHFWPGDASPAWRAFVRFAREHQPKAVILNGDVIDGATISRHPPINWEQRPTFAQELDVAKERLGELERAVPEAELAWPAGNHDLRAESRLASVAPEYAGIDGVHLKDHFSPRWQPCYACCINDDVVVKHRFKGGAHATYNNTLHAGKTIITGHLHSLDVRSFTDYNGTRWGIDCGTLAHPYGPQFMYCEDNVRNWRSGFIVLTFREGRLLRPEVVDTLDLNHVSFRGEVMEV